jgi:NodT family efflux transporter outer membrane factor (OMF) lipoprotein
MNLRFFRPLLPLAGACLLLASCSLGPDYRRPAQNTPQAYQQSVPAGPIWPEKGWWRGFGSPDLDGLVADAEAGNFDIQAAVARIRQADAQLRVSGAPLLPTLTGNASQNWNQTYLGKSSSSTFSLRRGYTDTRSSQLEASISYEVDVWGRVAALRDASAAAALFSRYDQQTVALTQVSTVATTWFTALAFQDRLAVAMRNLDDAEQIQRAITARRDAGTASELDVAQQGALVAGIRSNIPAFRSSAQQQINALGVLTGRLPEDIRVSPGTLNTLTLPEVQPGLPSDLLLRRPDVASAEAGMIQANANIRAARAAFYPQITLTGSGGWQSTALSTLFGPTSILANAAASAAQTIFDNGLKSAQYDLNAAKYDELVADYRRAVTQAFTDVENALTQYRYTTEQEALQRQAVAIAQRAADIARAQLLAGTSDIVVALQAQNTLFSDLDSLSQIRLQRFLALVNLYKALGGGWSTDQTVAPEKRLLQGVL